jgi:hypothetical protein
MNNKRKFLKSILASSLCCLALSFTARAEVLPDYAREARLADQIIDDIFEGEPIWLNANNHDFLAIHTLNEDQLKGTVILMHGRGYHPDWPDVVGPLRTGLPEVGWSTLSLQMPVLEKGYLYYDYLPILKYSHQRIEAAIALVRETSDLPIILAGHSCGAHMANDWLNSNDDSKIDGYIIMGAGATDYRQMLETPFPFAGMRVPIFDLYGELEYPRPLAMVSERKRLLKIGDHPDSDQQMLPNADHYFSGSGDSLTDAVGIWLNRTNFTPSS